MNKLKKFFFDLSQNLKGWLALKLSNYKNRKKLAKQKNLDIKLLAKVNDKKVPSFKQIKQLPKVLNRRESLLIKILGGAIIICVLFFAYANYYQKLKTVPADGGEYTEGLIGSPLYINPILAQSNVDADLDFCHLIYSGLFKYNAKLEIVPDLAEKYEISEDQKTYIFYIRKDAKWHDNENLTAADVAFTFNSILISEINSPLARSFEGVTIEQVDDYTIKFTLKEPYAAFLNLLTVGILPEHIWSEVRPNSFKLSMYNQKPIGSGPYKFKSLIKEKSGPIKYVLEKNKNYYGKIPYINKLNFKFYPDYENAVNGLINKEVEGISFLPKEYQKKFANKRDINLYNINLSQYAAVFFNQKNNELLKDKNVREALSYAIDKNKITEEVLQNQGQIIDGPILPGFLGYNQDIKKYEYDPKKALEILTGNGWALDGEILKKKDQTLKIVLTTVDTAENTKTANLIKDFWAGIGAEVEVQIVEKEKIEKEVISPRNYQALLYGEIIGYDPDLFPFWHSSQKDYPGANLAGYVNRKTDTLLEEARLNSQNDVRNTKYQEFQNLLIEDLPAIFLYEPSYSYPLDKKIKGFNLERVAKPFDRFIGIENWYIKTKKIYF